jgi:hypothetical protein
MSNDQWMARIEELLTMQQQQADAAALALRNMTIINGGIQNCIFAVKNNSPSERAEPEEEVTITAKVSENGDLLPLDTRN